MPLPDPLLEWPTTLPDISIGFVSAFIPVTATFGTDIGPAKTRARSTVQVQTRAVTLELDGDEAQDLRDFFANLANGTDPFVMPDPMTGGASLMRFKPPAALQFVNITAALAGPSKYRHVVQIEVERLGDAPEP